MTRRFSTDLTDSQWGITQALIPAANLAGRPRGLDMRQVVNGIIYLTVGGFAWRMLPHDYPPWQRVYNPLQPLAGLMVLGNGFMTGYGLDCANEMDDTSIPARAASTVKTNVTPTGAYDFDGARLLLQRLAGFTRKLPFIWVDAAYRGSLQAWVVQRLRYRLLPVLPPQEQRGFTPLARRWVVERTFAWIDCITVGTTPMPDPEAPASRPASRYDPVQVAV